MTILHFKAIFTDSSWRSDVDIHLDLSGKIEKIVDSKDSKKCEDYLIPGFINAHSHSFQYSMAGLAETAITGQDSFWSWRNLMYEQANQITPDKLYEVTRELYTTMIKSGYTSVCEFHYLFDPSQSKEMDFSRSILSAAKDSGIQLTFVPVLYQNSGFNSPPLKKQQRFVFDRFDQYQSYRENLKSVAGNAIVGIGAHSMRAVCGELLKEIFSLDHQTPTHIHISEQKKEIEECEVATGKRPVEWFLENIELRKNHHFVHATHLNDEELKGLSQSEATVVVCPSTEANLGDGIFRYKEYLQNNGSIAIGSDSHVGLNPFEELRWMEYSQRLLHMKRNILTSASHPNVAEYLIQQTQLGGAASSGREAFNKEGSVFDGVVIDGSEVNRMGLDRKDICSKLVFSPDQNRLIRHTQIGLKTYSQ